MGLILRKMMRMNGLLMLMGKYTNIEMYMNSLVHGIMEAGSKGGAVAD